MSGLLRSPRRRLLKRAAKNPLLSAQDWPYFINTVFNAGATRLPSGETLLLCRVEDCTGLSHLCAARSIDGVTNWRIDAEPTLPADPSSGAGRRAGKTHLGCHRVCVRAVSRK